MIQLSSNKRVLLIGGDGVVIYGPSGQGVERETSLSWDMPNFDEQLSEALKRQNSNRPLAVLFDGADQTYRKEENIPNLSALDRPRFVKRKLELAFPNYPIRASLEIKPSKKRARDEMPSYLFVALPETEQVDRVGRAVLESGVPVAGFGLLPAESAGLAPTIAGKLFESTGRSPSRWSVLIGQNETGGLRQVVVKDGNLALTRLTPTSDGGTTGTAWVEEVTREFRATMTYISRFGFSAEDGLDVVIICDDVSRQFFTAAGLGTDRFRCVTVADALRQIGAKSFGLDKTNYADGLHAAWVAKKRGLTLPIRAPSLAKIMAPRLAAQGLAVGLVFLSLFMIWMTFSALQSIYLLNQDIDQRASQKSMLERELAEESKVFETLPVKASLLRGTLNVKKLLDANTIPAREFTDKLKAVLGSEIYLSELDYTHQPGKALALGDVVAPSTPSIIMPGMAALQPGERGLIKVRFRFGLGSENTLEDKVNRAEQLQRQLLEAFPGWQVRISRQFGRVVRGGKFEGSLNLDGGASGGEEDMAEFMMEGLPK